jgi:hypothetical protein
VALFLTLSRVRERGLSAFESKCPKHEEPQRWDEQIEVDAVDELDAVGVLAAIDVPPPPR